MDDINDIQTKIRTSKEAGNRPVAIWDAETVNLWHAQDAATQKAWDDYANHEAQVEVNCGDPDRQPGTMYQWRPPFTFQQWLVQYKTGRNDMLARPLNYYDSSTDYLTSRERFDHLSPEKVRLVKEGQSLSEEDLKSALGNSQNGSKREALRSRLDTSGSATEVSPEKQNPDMASDAQKSAENRIATLKRQNDLLIVENEKLKLDLKSTSRISHFQLFCFIAAAICFGAMSILILISLGEV